MVVAWWFLVLLVSPTGSQLQVGFQYIQDGLASVSNDELAQAFQDVFLPVQGEVESHVMSLNATIIKGTCDAGWHWVDPVCLPCVCTVPSPGQAAAVWFELLVQ